MLARLLKPLFELLFEPLDAGDVHISLTAGVVSIAKADLRADFASSLLHSLVPMLASWHTQLGIGRLEGVTVRFRLRNLLSKPMVIEVKAVHIRLVAGASPPDEQGGEPEGNQHRRAHSPTESVSQQSEETPKHGWKSMATGALGRLANTSVVRRMIDNATLRVESIRLSLSPPPPEDCPSQLRRPELMVTIAGLQADGVLEQRRLPKDVGLSRKQYQLRKEVKIDAVGVSFCYGPKGDHLWLHREIEVDCSVEVCKKTPSARPTSIRVHGE